MRENSLTASSLVGFHIEGPFLSPEDGPRGAHDRKFIREPDFSLFEEWQEAAEGHIRYITVAPETKGALKFISSVAASGVKVAIGHTGAEPEIIGEAVAAGATLSTHLGNGSYTQLPSLKTTSGSSWQMTTLWLD